jgi:Zn-dependent protease with chaperone function
MHDLLSRDEGIALLVGAVIFLFLGPTVTVALRGGDGLSYFVLLNALAFIMPVALLVLWPAAFLWPRRQEYESSKPLSRPLRQPVPPKEVKGGVRLVRSRKLQS